MCNVSMVAQDWSDRMRQTYPNAFTHGGTGWAPQISRQEFDVLKDELQAIKKLLIAAKIYDKETNQPDCEDAEKIALFRGLAKVLGVDINDVFPEVAK